MSLIDVKMQNPRKRDWRTQVLRKIQPAVVAREDQEFLPAHLEILETPASPYAAAFVWLICSMFSAGLLWSCLASLDIHAVASGRIQPSGRSKVLQPLDAGKVRALFTANGAKVKAGDVLVKLDDTSTNADFLARKDELDALRGEIVHRNIVINAIRQNQPELVLGFPPDLKPDIIQRNEAAAMADVRQFFSARDSLVSQLGEKAAQQQRLTASIEARERLYAVLRERADMRQTLVAKEAGTRAAVIDAVQQVEQVSADLAYDRGQLLEAKAAAVSIQSKIQQFVEQTIAEQTQKLTDALQKREVAQQEVVKADLKLNQTTLKSPIDGTVQQLSITTIGQVVTPGQSLLVVVPLDGAVEIEALVLNQDIGFILPDQDATIKVDAFPFTRYGTIEGKVLRVSRDAVDERDASGSTDALSVTRGSSSTLEGTPKTQNLVFPVTIEPIDTKITVEGKAIPLTPGMTVTVEIRTGKRRVINYLLAPILETTGGAGHER